ncbi:Bax inhibitor-1/YccA family protein [Microbacterium sp. C7(2022)]|uniref:Bax inhibitor-1/YccA family protein n=1 Tax=Microbacterium sp. C7(2022) TaxID=2992759 RepID=UPI00237BF6AE|nr:Bax inhibitor-1/YccA family protein [Microbacterium sp. C7(2022)]MDE0547661.1 Bax inhibitor-1/YccA family protein [Microbacterium sp. C7(2022)]
MALNNPAFNNPAFQDQNAVRTYPGGAQAANLGGQTQFSAAQHAGTDAAAQAHLEGMYAAPSAGAIETDRMTVEDTVIKTVGLFAILAVTAVVGWMWTMAPVTVANPNPTILPWIVGGIGGFVMSMVVIFGSRKKIRPGAIFAYAAFEGLFIGGISAYFEFIWPGIVVQATLATLSVVGVTLALFASGKVRASKKATKIWMIAMMGYLVFSLINVFMMLFNAPMAGGPFGLYSEQIAGIPIGLILGVFIVFMAAYSLVMDFDQIQRGVRNGAPRKFGWMGAFGIMVTVVWLYVEILRIIAILRSN